MKTKTAAETANLGENHAYLGHFAKDKYINQGHNDSGSVRIAPKNKKQAEALVKSPVVNDSEGAINEHQFPVGRPMDEKIQLPETVTDTKDRNPYEPPSYTDRQLRRYLGRYNT